MKAAHVVLGLFWLIGGLLLFYSPKAVRQLVAICSIFSLWYLPFGTAVSLLELALVFLPIFRAKPQV